MRGGEFVLPVLDEDGVGVEVGDGVGDRFQRGVEGEGEAEEGTVEIEGRERLAAREELHGVVDCGTLQETVEFVGAFQEDSAGLRGHERDVAEELERVAEALLGVEENGAAGEGGAVPLGLAEIAAEGEEVAALPAPFVLWPAGGKIATVEEEEGEIAVGIGVVGLEGDGLAIGSGSVVEAGEIAEGVAEVIVSGGVAGVERVGLVVSGEGFVDVALGAEGVAEIEVGVGELGVELKGAAGGGDGFVEAAALLERVGKVVVEFGAGGLEGDGSFVGGDGIVEAGLFEIYVAEGGVEDGVGGLGGEGAVEEIGGGVAAAGLEGERAE